MDEMDMNGFHSQREILRKYDLRSLELEGTTVARFAPALLLAVYMSFVSHADSFIGSNTYTSLVRKEATHFIQKKAEYPSSTRMGK